jgi:hypothetical protein
MLSMSSPLQSVNTMLNPIHPLDSIAQAKLSVDDNRWDEKPGFRRDAIRSQVIDALEALEIKEAGKEDGLLPGSHLRPKGARSRS